ncbi:hypothetical protein CKALI_04680 [Corynebacterium kalinowskii]|uniref:PepSY domain-containing protein n=1 Tax=Corynebacterium kalinowskii TaxID=2675216 RepID=A0A6B8VK14_9CORY|nr:hypothetical protein [Corynebacterium kalinowskii]QGU01814.1 hypothetical protein CKALI_04680 [Corynebacterium kalinowskii]
MSTIKISAITLIAGTGLLLGSCSQAEQTANETSDKASSKASEIKETVQKEVSEQRTPTPAEGPDPVLAAIQAVQGVNPDGKISGIDRQDDSEIYSIDVAVGEEVIEYNVPAQGEATEKEREKDAADAKEAQDATVTIEDAIKQAQDQHPNTRVDDAELEAGNWEISLDDANGKDVADVKIPAK